MRLGLGSGIGLLPKSATVAIGLDERRTRHLLREKPD
jgi:hypothetical protein